MRRAFVTDFESGPRNIQVLVQHQALCLIRPSHFWDCNGLKAVKLRKCGGKCRRTHLYTSGEFLDTKQQGIVQFEPVNRLRNPIP